MKRKEHTKKIEEATIHLNERLNPEIVAKLKQASKQLEEAEKEKIEAAKEREKQQKREKEKNKSFEDLLNESNLDWKSYK